MVSNIEVSFYAGSGRDEGSVSFTDAQGEKQELDWHIDRYGEVATDREDTHALGLDDGDVIEIEAEVALAILEEEEVLEETEEEAEEE